MLDNLLRHASTPLCHVAIAVMLCLALKLFSMCVTNCSQPSSGRGRRGFGLLDALHL